MSGSSQIRTCGGDRGQTSLGSGERVSKLEPRIAAGGMIDELNCSLGTSLAFGVSQQTSGILQQLQNFLFDVGADVSIPLPASGAEDALSFRVSQQQIAVLEQLIADCCDEQPPMTEFILPGGSIAAALLHQARGVCRRAELAVLRAHRECPLNPQVPIAMNCLSDLLFVLARRENNNGLDDVPWRRERGIAPQSD